jgi:hypothetical protein
MQELLLLWRGKKSDSFITRMKLWLVYVTNLMRIWEKSTERVGNMNDNHKLPFVPSKFFTKYGVVTACNG